MASEQNTADFIIEQIAKAGSVTARKMFGEYSIYCDGKIVALVADDKLYVKPTKAGRSHIGEVTEAAPYKGAKPCFLIPGQMWEEGAWLTELVRLTTAELPMPARKRKSNSPQKETSRCLPARNQHPPDSRNRATHIGLPRAPVDNRSGSCGEIKGGKEARPSFLKKRSKRLLAGCRGSVRRVRDSRPKVFWFFFSKKNCLPCLALPP